MKHYESAIKIKPGDIFAKERAEEVRGIIKNVDNMVKKLKDN